MRSYDLFFIQKNKKKYKIHDWIILFIDWIKNITYLENYIVLGPSYNLPKIHDLLF